MTKKIMYKLVSALLLVLLMFGISAEAKVTMFSADGRKIEVSSGDVSAYKKVGWYEGVKMYAMDGRSRIVSPFNVKSEKAVGWYDNRADVYTLLYAPDGRIIEMPKGKAEEYVKAGWSTKPVSFKISERDSNHIFGDGVLQISGPSVIPHSYTYARRKDVKTLYVCHGITQIDGYAFDSCANLSRVELPPTLTKFGKYAFDGTKINRIGIPKSVTDIDAYSFDVYGLASYSDSPNKNTVIYCEQGSKAEEFAKAYNLKYVYASVIYSADSKRTMMVDSEEKRIYLASGMWSEKPVMKMYDKSGKSVRIAYDQVEAYKKVGWYDNIEDTKTTMYATDGRTVKIFKSEVSAYKKSGWFRNPPVKMYAMTGKTVFIEPDQVEAYKKVGWYTNKSDVQTTMYAADGKTTKVYKADVESYKKVGWYENKKDIVVKMFSLGGKITEVYKANVAKEQAVGWYLFDDYISALVNTQGYETALDALDNLYSKYSSNNTIDETTYKTKYSQIISKYYQKTGCPLAVLGWRMGTNSIGTPEVTITFRNVSPKTIVAFDQLFTCLDAYGSRTADYSWYNGDYTGYCNNEHIASGTKFSRTWTLYSNERTQKITWPTVLKVAFGDGSAWYK